MLFKVTVTVMLKGSVLDPQGAAVERAIQSYGQSGLKSVRIGKVVELLIEARDQGAAEVQAGEWADKLLANPIMENYSIEVEQIQSAQQRSSGSGVGRQEALEAIMKRQAEYQQAEQEQPEQEQPEQDMQKSTKP